MPPQTWRMPVLRRRRCFVKCLWLLDAGWKLSTGLSRMQRESRFLTSHSLHLCHPCPAAQNRHVAMVAAILSGKNRTIMSLDSRWGENFLGFIFVSSLVSEDWKTKSKQHRSRNVCVYTIYLYSQPFEAPAAFEMENSFLKYHCVSFCTKPNSKVQQSEIVDADASTLHFSNLMLFFYLNYIICVIMWTSCGSLEARPSYFQFTTCNLHCIGHTSWIVIKFRIKGGFIWHALNCNLE